LSSLAAIDEATDVAFNAAIEIKVSRIQQQRTHHYSFIFSASNRLRPNGLKITNYLFRWHTGWYVLVWIAISYSDQFAAPLLQTLAFVNVQGALQYP
jgi:hypothetical protein